MTSPMADTMRIVELESALTEVLVKLAMCHNGFIDIAIMIDEGDIDQAKAKAESFFVAKDEGDLPS